MNETEHRFWEKTQPEGECLLWTGKRDKWGYGVVRMGSKFYLAHRVAYLFAFGEFDQNLQVLHTGCEQRACVNPEHLALGTHADQVRLRKLRGHDPIGDKNGLHLHPERAARGERHGSRTHPEAVARGERHYAAKLTEEQITAIRLAYASGTETFWSLASTYHVNQATIWKVVQGKSWSQTCERLICELPGSHIAH